MNFLPSPSQKRSSPFIGLNFNKKINHKGLVQKRKRLEEDEEKVISYKFHQLERSFQNLNISNKEKENINKESNFIEKGLYQRIENEINLDKLMSKIKFDSNNCSKYVDNKNISLPMKELSLVQKTISITEKQNEINHMMNSLKVDKKSIVNQSYEDYSKKMNFHFKNNLNKENENTFNHLVINTDLDFSFCAEETNTRKKFPIMQQKTDSNNLAQIYVVNNSNKINECSHNNDSIKNQKRNLLKEFFPKNILNEEILNNSEEINANTKLIKNNFDRKLGGSVNWGNKYLSGNAIPGFHSTLRFRERAEFDLKIKKQKDMIENIKRLSIFY